MHHVVIVLRNGYACWKEKRFNLEMENANVDEEDYTNSAVVLGKDGKICGETMVEDVKEIHS